MAQGQGGMMHGERDDLLQESHGKAKRKKELRE
jgi:hypothetical protein